MADRARALRPGPNFGRLPSVDLHELVNSYLYPMKKTSLVRLGSSLSAMLWLGYLWRTGLPWWGVLVGLAVITGAYVCGHVEGAASQDDAIKAAEAEGFMRGKASRS